MIILPSCTSYIINREYNTHVIKHFASIVCKLLFKEKIEYLNIQTDKFNTRNLRSSSQPFASVVCKRLLQGFGKLLNLIKYTDKYNRRYLHRSSQLFASVVRKGFSDILCNYTIISNRYKQQTKTHRLTSVPHQLHTTHGQRPRCINMQRCAAVASLHMVATLS